MNLPEKKYIASFDIDAQNTFTPVCPDELAVAEGDMIADELNAQAKFASLRIASRDAHSMSALWISDAEHAPLSPSQAILTWISAGLHMLSSALRALNLSPVLTRRLMIFKFSKALSLISIPMVPAIII